MKTLLTLCLLMAYTVNYEIYQFEDAIETAVASHLLANGVNDQQKQRDIQTPDGKTTGLKSPRVEVKVIWNGFGTERGVRYWINQSDKTKWPDCGDGKLYLTIVTRRGAEDQSHARLRGTCRGLMQSCSALNGRMALHSIEWLREAGNTPEVRNAEHHDVSVMAFDFRIRILFDSKTSDIFPTV
jgi:hypothetical protein